MIDLGDSCLPKSVRWVQPSDLRCSDANYALTRKWQDMLDRVPMEHDFPRLNDKNLLLGLDGMTPKVAKNEKPKKTETDHLFFKQIGASAYGRSMSDNCVCCLLLAEKMNNDSTVGELMMAAAHHCDQAVGRSATKKVGSELGQEHPHPSDCWKVSICHPTSLLL